MADLFKTKGKSNTSGNQASSKSSVTIDFPRERDVVISGHYAIRISGNSLHPAEVSINNGNWKSCRMDGGYHWFDWNPEKPGTYKLLARLKSGLGTWETSPERTCVVMHKKGK